MSEDFKGGIGLAAALVTILGFFGLRTIYDILPKDNERPQAAEPTAPIHPAPQPVYTESTVQPQRIPVKVSIPPPPAVYEVHVPAQDQWVDTSVDLDAGQFIEINATGRVRTLDTSYETVGPSGGLYQCTQDCTYPPGVFGQLIGSVGSQDNIFIVGQHISTKVQRPGRLYLAVNDCCNWGDNSGSFTASISVHR